MDLYSLSTLFYKLTKIADVPSFAPDSIKSYLAPIQKVDKNPKLKPFRVKVSGNDLTQDLNYFFDELVEQVESMIALSLSMGEIAKSSSTDKDKVSLISKLMELIRQLHTNLTLEAVADNKIVINNNSYKLSKAYNLVWDKVMGVHNSFEEGLVQYIRPRTEDIKRFENVDNYDNWSSRLKPDIEYEVVFSVDPYDVLTMSSRSNWTSCQDLRKPGGNNANTIHSVIGSALAKNIGIIYLTAGKPHIHNGETVGENMVLRSAVWVVYDEEGEEYLLLPKMYPTENTDVLNLFVSQLQKHHPEFKVIVGEQTFKLSLDSEGIQSPNHPDNQHSILPYTDADVEITYNKDMFKGVMNSIYASIQEIFALPYLVPEKSELAEIMNYTKENKKRAAEIFNELYAYTSSLFENEVIAMVGNPDFITENHGHYREGRVEKIIGKALDVVFNIKNIQLTEPTSKRLQEFTKYDLKTLVWLVGVSALKNRLK